MFNYKIIASGPSESVESEVKVYNLVIESWRLDEKLGHFPTATALISTLTLVVH